MTKWTICSKIDLLSPNYTDAFAALLFVCTAAENINVHVHVRVHVRVYVRVQV